MPFAGKYDEPIQDQWGNYLPTPTVLVKNLDQTEATVYTNRYRTTEAANPFTVADGRLVFFADPGDYLVDITYMGTLVLEDFEVQVPTDPEIAVTTAEGVPLFAYGDSWMASDATNSVGTRYIVRLERRLHTTLSNRATNSYHMQDNAQTAFSNHATKKWITPTKGLVVVGSVLADVLENGSDPAGLASFEHAVRAMCVVLSSGTRTEESDASFVYSGTWTTTTSSLASGGSVRTTTQQAAYVDITVGSGDHYLSLLSVADFTDLATIKNGAATIATVGDVAVPASVNNWNYIFTRVTGPGTFRVQKVTNDAKNIWVDARVTLSATPPTILLVKGVYLPAAGYAAEVGGATDTSVDEHNDILDTVAAEFDNVEVVDPLPGWDKTTMIASENLHPKDRGMAHLADAVDMKLATLGWRDGMHL